MEYIPNRIFIKLSPRVSLALAQVAQKERRDPREQAALILARALEEEQVVGELPGLELATLMQIAKDEGLSSAAEAMSLIIREWVGLKRELSLSVEE